MSVPSPSPKLIQFKNCRIIRKHELLQEDLWIREGKIINPERVFFDEQVSADQEIDCNGAIIAPGYIDIQINGGYGIDFSHETVDVQSGICTVAKRLIENGVTSFCPTLVTSPKTTYKKVIPNIPKTTDGANVLGVHLEGPFINPRKKGAHDEKSLKTFEKGLTTLMETYGSLENVKIITLAPELDTTGEIVKFLVSKNIVVSLGHSEANLCDGEVAVQNGATLITHLFNAMLPFHHRDPGLVGLLASTEIPGEKTVYFGIIADGVHTHPAALRIAHRIHPNGLILVTDAISAMGLQEGVHHIGELAIEVRNGQAFIANTSTLCGSIVRMDKCVQLFRKATECSIVYAIETVTLHPAQCLNIDDQKGSLNFGCDADFILLDDELNVLSTWIDGKCVYKML